MKLHFDANQKFQREAIDAVCDLFATDATTPGAAPGASAFALDGGSLAVYGNVPADLPADRVLAGLPPERLRENLRAIQTHHDLPISDSPHAGITYGGKREADAGLHFSVEMETGTGKTYVYLRTLHELRRRYGLTKFILVVPSVAIREGVMKSLELTREHFKALYDCEPDFYKYDAKRVSQLRQFATANTMQVLVMNIDAFRKNFSDDDTPENAGKSNVFYKATNALNDFAPADFVRAVRPVVVIDEPQSVDNTPKAQRAIRELRALFTLRYSATHKAPYNLVYRLDPVASLRLGLVKQIVVGSITAEGDANRAFVRLDGVDYRKPKPAKVTIYVKQGDTPKQKSVSLKGTDNLFTLSGELEMYRHGWGVTEINGEPGAEFITFANGVKLTPGDSTGGQSDDLLRLQIRKTIEKHLNKELELLPRRARGEGVKVLSLFFLNKVADYRADGDTGDSATGECAKYFEEEFAALLALPKYAPLKPEYDAFAAAGKPVHAGYFSKDKKGAPKDTRGDSADDESTYELIMKNKEGLLDLDESRRFLFSHSALREGWDNPNVFQICNLRAIGEAGERRQTIGRGLRLPVNEKGLRETDRDLCRLTVIANEGYKAFAAALQTDYENECGVTFGKLPGSAFARLVCGTDAAGEPLTLGHDAGERLRDALVAAGLITTEGRITEKFKPERSDFTLALPPEFAGNTDEVLRLLKSYRIESQVQPDRDPVTVRPNKQVLTDPAFLELWKRIAVCTRYRVEFDTRTLVTDCVAALKAMPPVPPLRALYEEAKTRFEGAGIETDKVNESVNVLEHRGALPDPVGYLQAETELTRATLVDILKGCGRLPEFAANPQGFLSAAAPRLRRKLAELALAGIRYEKTGEVFEMRLFDDDAKAAITTYLDSRYTVQNKTKEADPKPRSLYDTIAYDSEPERAFAEALDKRDDVRLFVKLPPFFKVPTPVGGYNPDWAIVTTDDKLIYLIRETKGSIDRNKLRPDEKIKVDCGERHFGELGVDYRVVTTADNLLGG